jgi:transposase
MLELFLPARIKKVVVYPSPVNMRFGVEALRKLCTVELDIEARNGIVVLFYNQAKNMLKLYWEDPSGDQTLTKRLERGAFLVPVVPPGAKYTTVPAATLRRLFR